jgi:ATP-binding cassette subfamily B protein
MFSKIGAFFPNIQSSLACVDRVDSVFASATEEDRNSSHSVDSEKFDQVKIICEDVSFAYEGGSKILDKLSVAFEPGKITAITGPSGSGKTTLVKLILRLQAHQSGCIKMNNIDYDTLSNFQIRNSISYVAQFPYIFNGTIADNIRCGNLEATDDEIINAAKAGGAHEFIISREDGYNTILTDNGNNLSGGQRQRIALARAFLKNAPVLIMDEATTGVDSETEEFIYKTINEIVAKGVTVIMIAHRLSTINNADVKYVMENLISYR